jgi:large subunit ribosomal protein L24
MAMNIKVGDTVQVIRGNERTTKPPTRGKVLAVLVEDQRVRVEGVRVVKRHIKRGRDPRTPEGGIIEKPGSIALANVMLVCPKCSTPTRVGRKLVGEGKAARRVRVCKQCDAQIDDTKS